LIERLENQKGTSVVVGAKEKRKKRGTQNDFHPTLFIFVPNVFFVILLSCLFLFSWLNKGNRDGAVSIE
jgi:hypothetical protein